MLKNLRSLFIVDDEDDAKKGKENKDTEKKTVTKGTGSDKPVPPKANAGKAPQKPVTTTFTDSSYVGKVEKKMVERLLKVVEKHNLEGFDYLEYKKSLKALEKMNMDEVTKFRSAFATASTMGVTMNKLIETIDYYKKVLNRENATFAETVQRQIEAKVSQKRRDMESFEKAIKDKTLQIEKIKKEIGAHQAKIENLSQKIQQDSGLIKKTRDDFTASYNYLIEQIDYDAAKIKEYLK